MSIEQLKATVQNWDKSYGVLFKWGFKLILYPVVLGSFYLSSLYLDSHYVSKSYFDSSMAKVSEIRKEGVSDEKQEFAVINKKLDALLLTGASDEQRLLELERRVGKVEDRTDRLTVR